MKTIKLNLLFIFLIISLGLHSQVTIKTNGLEMTPPNSPTESITECETIDIGLHNSVGVYCPILLSKPNAQTLGDCKILTYYKKSATGSAIVVGSYISINENNWSTCDPNTYSTSLSPTLNAADFNATG